MSVLPAKVLLATDGSEEADRALRVAVELAEKTGGELHLIHVWSAPLYYHPERHGYPQLYEKQLGEAQQKLGELVERVTVSGGSVAEAHLGAGSPAHEIVATAEDLGASLVVMGSRGLGGLRRSLMGSVSESVMRHAHCPVMVVRSPGREYGAGERMSLFPTKILAATDGSPGSALAVREAVDLARDTDSELHVTHVLQVSTLYSSADIFLAGGVPLYEESRRKSERVLAEGIDRTKEAGVPVVESHLLEGKPDVEVVDLAEEIGAGLIVLGSRGLGALARSLVGSTSTSIVRHAHCPVMVVREEKGGNTDHE